MHRTLLPAVVGLAVALTLTPVRSEAFGRRCQPAPICPPVVWVPACPAPVAYAPCPAYYPQPSFCPPASWNLAPSGCVVLAPAVPVDQQATTLRIRGKSYTVRDAGDQSKHQEDEEDTTVTGAGTGVGDVFAGKSRGQAKTTGLTDEPVEVASVGKLHATLELPTDQKMAEMGISRKFDSPRVAVEKKSVRVKAFVYAFKKENDNDYHVIIGDDPDAANPVFFNVEVSGLPVGGTAENRAVLKVVREEFKTAFDLGDTGPKRYRKLDPPVPVEITGSLFWDVDHSPPNPLVGPEAFKPKSAWELHPVTKIKFLDP